MAQYSESILQEIRTRVDIVDLVGQYVPLRRAGANHKGICPFHKEKSPSFNVHPEKQIYRCFGCGASGTVFNFLMQYEGLTFPEAVRHLAERAGVTLDQTGPAGPSRQLTDRLKQINKAATALYEKLLQKEREGEAARQYLASRGMDLAMAAELGLGYAPESWDFTRNALTRQGFEISELEASGLVKKAPESADRYYDRFRNRLVFPIADPYGVVIAFGGRTLGDDQAKYINSPESPIYHKGQQLFGLHLARDAVKEAGFLLLVEGNFDCVLPWSRGIKNVAASLGTALTAAHARLVKRYTDRVTVLFDQDEAGQSSQRKAAELLLAEGFEVRIATLDKHKDPADYVLHEGAEALRKRLAAAEEAIVFYARQAAEQMGDATPRARARAVASVLPLIEKIVDPIERAESLVYVAQHLAVDEALVRAEMAGRNKPEAPAKQTASVQPRASGAELPDEVERYLLRAFALRPDYFVRFLEQRDPGELKSAIARELMSALSSLHVSHRSPQLSDLIDQVESEACKKQVIVWGFEAVEPDVLDAQFEWALEQLQQRNSAEELSDLQRRLKEASREAERPESEEQAWKRAKESLLESVNAARQKLAEPQARQQALSGPAKIERKLLK